MMMSNPHCSQKEHEEVAALVLLLGNFFSFFSLKRLLLICVNHKFHVLPFRGERKPKVDPKIELFRTCIAAIPRSV